VRVAVELVARLQHLGGLSLIPRAGFKYRLARGERQPQRGVALGHQRDPLDRLAERRRGQLADRGGAAGQQRPVRRELAPPPPGGGPPPPPPPAHPPLTPPAP